MASENRARPRKCSACLWLFFFKKKKKKKSSTAHGAGIGMPGGCHRVGDRGGVAPLRHGNLLGNSRVPGSAPGRRRRASAGAAPTPSPPAPPHRPAGSRAASGKAFYGGRGGYGRIDRPRRRLGRGLLDVEGASAIGSGVHASASAPGSDVQAATTRASAAPPRLQPGGRRAASGANKTKQRPATPRRTARPCCRAAATGRR